LKEQNASTFRIIVNGKHIFARGTDWIPADLFIPRVSKEKYKRLIEYSKNGGMNIMRVWGGGFYENDIFYELCDEMGILVWQDFMFACAAYPDYSEFVENVSEEFRQNIKRLQNHASLAIWCGNNENEWIYQNEQKRSYKEMPGFNIYHKILPDILTKLDPKRPYWPSSPFGFDENPNSETSGNRHQWEIWSMWKDYSHVREDNSLFVTEFGFQAPANRLTLEEAIPLKDRNVQGEIFEFHNKQVEGNERLFRFLSGHLPVKTRWEDYIYLTQLNQGLALKTCLEHWRSNYPVTNGSIIWQHNDCWPVASWALIDSNLLPKQSYYHVKNIFSQQIITFVKKEKSIEILLINSSLKIFAGSVNIQIINLAKGKVEFTERKVLTAKSNSKEVISSIADYELIENGTEVVLVTIYDEKEVMVHRNYYVWKEWKYMSLPKAEVSMKKSGDDSIVVETDKPAFFVTLESDGIVFDNNSFILLPGEKEILKTNFIKDVKLKVKSISVVSLNNYLS
jgi:beta-mannosidase